MDVDYSQIFHKQLMNIHSWPHTTKEQANALKNVYMEVRKVKNWEILIFQMNNKTIIILTNCTECKIISFILSRPKE